MPHDAQASLAALIESTEDHIWSVDRNYALILFNRAFQRHIEQVYGFRAAVGMHVEDMFLPERAALLLQFFKRALSEGSFRTEHSLLDGHILEMAFNPIVVDGEATGVSVFGKDITERKTAERALEEAENKYRNIFDGALEGMFQASLEGRPLSANRAVARMLGYDSVDELLSTVKDVGHDVIVDPGARSRYLRKLEEHGAALGFECRFKRKDGTILWVSLNIRKVCGTDGKASHIEGFFEDITERKRAEMQLRDSEQRYRSIFEQAAVGIEHTSLEGRILRCNECFAQIIGYPLDEIPGMTFRQITAPEDLDKSVGVFNELLKSATGTASWEKRYVRKDGSLTWARLKTSTQRDGQGRSLHLITIVEDINARKTAEERLAAAQEALRVSEARYRTVFQTSPNLIDINRLDDGTYIDANKAYLDILGFEREEVIGRTSWELNIWADPRDRQNFVEMLRQNSNCRNLACIIREGTAEGVLDDKRSPKALLAA
jgi:PAS domain S-box-containing protein